MHLTAKQNCRAFLDAYLPAPDRPLRVIDIGAQDVNGSLKELVSPPLEYVGVDFEAAKGVDVVLEDPYVLPFPDASADVVLSSSCFEHSEMFWVLFLEVLRILKPSGLFYLNVPSNGAFHRYPVDCWRFYPDSGNALVRWAGWNGYTPMLMESYISLQAVDNWNDFVAVFLKDRAQAAQYPRRILDSKQDIYNGQAAGATQFTNFQQFPEDQARLNPPK